MWAKQAENYVRTNKPEINAPKTWEMARVKEVKELEPVINYRIQCKCKLTNKPLGDQYENYWDLQQVDVPLQFKLFGDKESWYAKGNMSHNTLIPRDSLVSYVLYYCIDCKKKPKVSALENNALQTANFSDSPQNEIKLRKDRIFDGMKWSFI